MIADDSKKKNEFLAANLAYNSAKSQEEKSEATEWHKQANLIFTECLMKGLPNVLSRH